MGVGHSQMAASLAGVYLDLAMAKYMAQVIHITLKKSTFLYLRRAGECEGVSGWNGVGVSAPRGYNYTQGYC